MQMDELNKCLLSLLLQLSDVAVLWPKPTDTLAFQIFLILECASVLDMFFEN